MWLLSTVALAQSGPETTQDPGNQQKVPIDVYEPPHPKSIKWVSGRAVKTQGCWVELAMMVDKKGKPFEVTVIQSTGSKDFEREAIQAIQQSPFEPGTLNGKPVASSYEFTYLAETASQEGVRKGFLVSYNSLIEDIKAGDRAAADAARKKLKITTSYEDAYFGLAAYKYAVKWEDESQQLDGLRRAIVWQGTAHYLPQETFRYALLMRLQLELKSRQYAEALTTAKRLEKVGIDPETAAELKAAAEKLDKIRTDDTSYEVAGWIPERNWFLHLFKQHFRAIVSDGNISEAKLRCEKRYDHFAFDSNLQYQVDATKDGHCSIELIGSPGTRFRFVQF